jgi:hypothetical protein
MPQAKTGLEYIYQYSCSAGGDISFQGMFGQALHAGRGGATTFCFALFS